MTADHIALLVAVAEGGSILRSDLEWLRRGGYIDDENKLTARGARTLAEHEDDQRGLE